MNSNLPTTPDWERADNLSDLVVVPLEETQHTLLNEYYMDFKTHETRGISVPVTVQFKNVSKLSYEFFKKVSMGTSASSTSWNIISDLNVKTSCKGIKYFHIGDHRVPFTQTIFQKNNPNDSPFPNITVMWNKRHEMPQVHVELEQSGDITISYDKIYTPNTLGRNLVMSGFRIPIEEHTLECSGGYVLFDPSTLIGNDYTTPKTYFRAYNRFVD